MLAQGAVNAGVLGRVFRTMAETTLLSRTPIIGSGVRAIGSTPPSAASLYASTRALSAGQLAALSSLACAFGLAGRAPLRRTDALVAAGVRALCSFPTASTTTTTRSTNTSYHHVTSSSKSVSFYKPIPPQELVPTLQSLVLAGAHHDPQLDTIVESAISAMPHLTPQQISDLTVGFAQLGHFNTRFKSRAADEIVSRLAEFPPTALANAAWAFGELQYLDCILLTAILPHVHANCDQFSATDLAKVLWVYARVGYRDESLADIMSAMAAKMGADFCPKTLSEVVFATAQLGWAEAEVVEALAAHALDNLPAYEPESLGKLAFGLASCGMEEPELFAAIGDRAVAVLDDMRPVDMVRVLWALSQIGHYHKEFLAKVTETALPATMHLYDRDELKMLVLACNKLGCTTQSVADAAQLLQQREDQLPDEDVGTPVPAASW